MKIGVRTSSLKKSFKARTTGRINRTLKKSVNPLYEKKEWAILRILKGPFITRFIIR